MTNENVEALIQRHIQRYAEIDIQDIYKLLHEAVFGPGHAITKKKAAQEWLDWQGKHLESLPNQSILESIHPDDAIVRLYLPPYLGMNGNIKKLMDSFVESAKGIDGDPATIAGWWSVFQGMTEKDHALAERFNPRTAALIGRTRANEHWPANHHSSTYDNAYKPVYRVMTRTAAEKLLGDQKIAFTLI